MRLFLGAVLFVFALTPTANAVTGSFAPGFDANGISVDGVFGSGYFLQSVVGRGRFHVTPSNPDTVDPSLGKSNDYRQPIESDDSSVFTDLTWFLGYNYFQSSSGIYSDIAHSFRLGFAFDIGERFDLTASATYQIIPIESYDQGIFEADASYCISLKSNKSKEKIEGDDAEAYYLRQAKAAEEVEYPPKDQFPNLVIGSTFAFSQYQKNPVTDARFGLEPTITSAQTLNMSRTGPYLTLNLTRMLSFKAQLEIYEYDVSANTFADYNAMGTNRPRLGLAIADLNDTTLLLNTYAYRSGTGSVVIKVTPTTTIQGALMETSYNSTIVANQFSIAGLVTQQLRKNVRVGGELDLSGGTPVGGVNAGFQF
jgi:hypothetical protein